MEKLKLSPYLYEYKTTKGDFMYVNSYNSRILKVCKNEKKEFDRVIINPTDYEYKHLLSNGILVPHNFNIEIENQKLLDEFYEKKERLHLIILPTEGCNFRCKYCYEVHEPKRMNEDTMDGIIKFVREKLPAYKYLQVEWFGGEPLIEKKLVTKLTDELRLLCKEFKKPYFSSMTTNGYLLNRDVFKSMFSNRVTNYQITLDGISATHDKYRPYVNEDGTFSVILNNLKRIRDEEKSQFISVIIRCNITKPILEHFDDYIDLMEKEFGNDSRFGFLWKIAWNPKPNIESNEYCEAGTLEELLTKYQNRKILFTPIAEQFKKFGMVCYGGNPHSYVIRSNGVISKCTVAFDDELNNLGSIEKYKNTFNNNNFDYWTKHKIDSICSRCYLFPSCLGIHCPRKNRDENGNRICLNNKEENNIYLEYIANNKELYMEVNDLWK